MAAEFIGLESIRQNLERFNFDAIGVYDKKLEKFKKVANEGETEEDLILSFEEWADRMLQSNPVNFKTYSIQLYDMPEGAKKLRGTISFTFALMNPIASTKETKITGDYITKREMQLALENQSLRFQIEQIQNRLNQMDLEDDEDDEDYENDTMGSVKDAVMGKLPQLIDVVLNNLLQPKTNQPMAMAGVNDINEIITEFKTINPDIEADLQKLLNLAKTNPQLFNMLINQLRAM
jgi:hypothetical protein